jgi:methanogenic corrinoid protein MtbC1
MENWLHMQTFYHGLNNSTREIMDVVAGSAFLSLTISQATTLMEKMVSKQERWRYALAQGGRHAIYQDGPADEEAR